MGFIRNEAIVVTGDPGEMEIARSKAIEIGLRCTDIVSHATNGDSSFLIVPDGSKEGWPDSDLGNEQRDTWKAWAKKVRGKMNITTSYGHRISFYPDWVHVSYDEKGRCAIEDCDSRS